MAFDYAKSATTALALITKFGAAVPIRRISKTFDPIEGETSAATKVSGSVKAVVLPINATNAERLPDKWKEALTSGRLRHLLVAAKGAPYDPQAGDILDLESAVYIVLGCSALNPAGVPLVYTIFAERGSLSAVDAAASEAP